MRGSIFCVRIILVFKRLELASLVGSVPVWAGAHKLVLLPLGRAVPLAVGSQSRALGRSGLCRP